MKKRFIVSAFLLCLILTGCGGKEKTITSDINKQLEAIQSEQENITQYDLYNRIHVNDSAYRLDDIDNKNLNKIFGSLKWEITGIQANNNTAIIALDLTAKDVDEILSQDYVMTTLILDYVSYVRENPNAERAELDSYILDRITQIIQENNVFSTTHVMANAYLSEKTGEWEIAYDDAFIDAMLGGIEKNYAIDMDDICEEAEKAVDINYDYTKVLNLPDSNKTTRSSIKTPINFNEEAYFDNSDYFFQKERYEARISVSDVIRGSKAKELIDAAATGDTSMRVLDMNTEYIIFKVDVKLVNNMSAEKTIEITTEDFSLLDSKGHFYNNCITFGLDEFEPLEEGDSTSGYVCFTIDKGVTPYLLFKDYMDNTLVFSNLK